MKRFQQVRLVANPSRYGQIAAIREGQDTHETGPLCDLNVQWAGDNGDPTCHNFEEVRLETFFEFLFMRKTIGKMNLMLAAFCFLVWAAILLPCAIDLDGLPGVLLPRAVHVLQRHPAMSPYEISICSALCAVVFAVVLASEDTPLGFYFRWADEWREAGGWRSWIASPLGGCEKCLAGQLSIWASILIRGGHSVPDILVHFATASLGVLLAATIAHAYRWLKRRI